MLWLLLLQVWASCLWLGHSEVVNSFSTCSQFFYRGIFPSSALQTNSSALICQRYMNQYFFATLYNTQKRIPVYSAYIYQRGPGDRPAARWMIEPQLVNRTYPKQMETEGALKNMYHISEIQISQSQAINKDYDYQTGWNRGHLNPSGHQNSNVSRTATFTLTNVVPQNSSLNKGAWKSYEQKTVVQRSQNCQATYIIVGAVPGNRTIANGRINIPSHIWSGACCKMNNTMSAWAAIAQNDRNHVDNITLGDLEGRLSRLYNRGPVSLFHSDCPR
ncbi:ENDD1 protein, partial [Furnarius figulus]|nr:ENDD1 protein [Furnarius figulus]